MVFAPFAGWSAGYGVDTFKDLAGLGECKRSTYPGLVKGQNPDVKKGLMASLVAAYIGAMAGIYFLTPVRNESLQDSAPIVRTFE